LVNKKENMKSVKFEIHMNGSETIAAGCDKETFDKLIQRLRDLDFQTYLEIKNLGIIINARHIEFIREM